MALLDSIRHHYHRATLIERLLEQEPVREP
jgi:hypothetical protein